MSETKGRNPTRSIVSARLPNESIVETVHRPADRRTLFCVYQDGRARYEARLTDRGQVLVPYSPKNNLLLNDVVRLPSHAEEYPSEEALVAEIQAYVHRYVDLSPLFERIASYYILLSWLYDAFAELPYLRVIGDPGSGKTRFLLVVGSICYKPIFASGASSVSPIFRILDAFRGTLVVDEGDFRQSDERAEITKILNNGNARGFPVLRSEVNTKGEYNPTAFHVFGPKIIATRGYFQDRALESRCITEHMGNDRLRDDIPINLPPTHRIEALRIRNRLLMYRFRNVLSQRATSSSVDRDIEPRLQQVFSPLLSVIGDDATRAELIDLAQRYHRDLQEERGMSTEARVLAVIRDIRMSEDPTLSVKAIATWFEDRHGDDYERKITAKWIGWIIRCRLHLKTQKRNGVYGIGDAESRSMRRLFERYGIGTTETRYDDKPDADHPDTIPDSPGSAPRSTP